MAFAKRTNQTASAREIFLQRALLRKQELQRKTTASFGEWLPQATPAYTWDWDHLRYVQKYMDMVTNKEIRNLMVFLPPRHGKSEQITVRYPPYMLERDPASRLVITSATASLAEKFSRKSRAIVRSRSIVELDKERQSVKDWRTMSGGGLRAIGVGGSIVGEGFDMLLIDDPVASRAEVESLTYREFLWNWYKDDLYTRREPGAGMVLQVTRWHEDDLAGRILENNLIGTEEEWVVISLPALCEGNDPPDYPQREVGEALCPARVTREELLLKKQTMGSSFDALYQQRPSPAEGDIFKADWFKKHVNRFPLHNAKLTQVWDTAFEKGERNDFAAMVEGYKDPTTGLIYVAAMENEKMEFPELVRAMRQHRDRIGPNSDTCVENKATGKPARQQLRLQGVPIIEIDPGTSDKIVRAKSVTSYCESLMVVFVDVPGNKNAELLSQLLYFPNGTHDDLVDAFVHFLRRVTSGAQRWDKATLEKFNTALRGIGSNYD